MKWWRKIWSHRRPSGSCSECWSISWRPALNKHDPVRLCSKCGHCEALTIPEFYAQFGRMPYGGIVGKETDKTSMSKH